MRWRGGDRKQPLLFAYPPCALVSVSSAFFILPALTYSSDSRRITDLSRSIADSSSLEFCKMSASSSVTTGTSSFSDLAKSAAVLVHVYPERYRPAHLR